MKLRYRVLALLAFMLLAILAGSLWVVRVRVRDEILRNVDTSLEAALSSYQTAELRDVRFLEILAGALESNPTFRTILRRTDRPTLVAHLKEAQDELQVGLIIVTDASGKLLARTQDLEASDEAHASLPSIAGALQGRATWGYWELPSALVRTVSVPIEGAHGLVEGSVSVGVRMDSRYVQQLQRDLGNQVLLVTRYAMVTARPNAFEPNIISQQTSGLQQALGKTSAGKSARLGFDDRGIHYRAAVRPLRRSGSAPSACIVISRDLTQTEHLLSGTTWDLGLLGILALGAAMAIAIPLIGQVTRPSELLETVAVSVGDGVVGGVVLNMVVI